MDRAQARLLAIVGGALTLLVAPFAALSDTPFAPGGVDALPPHARAMWDAAGPALTFADAGAVLRVWYGAFAFGAGMVAAAGLAAPRAATTILTRRLAVAALVAFAAIPAGTALEAVGVGPIPMVGFALYLPATFLAPLLALAAGAAGLRGKALPRRAAWALLLAPAATFASAFLLPQFPAGTGLGTTLAWAAAAWFTAE